MRVSKPILAIVFAISSLVTTLKPLPLAAAEKITFSLSFFGEFNVSVEDLAVFAEQGEVTPDFSYYANRLDEKRKMQRWQPLLNKHNKKSTPKEIWTYQQHQI